MPRPWRYFADFGFAPVAWRTRTLIFGEAPFSGGLQARSSRAKRCPLQAEQRIEAHLLGCEAYAENGAYRRPSRESDFVRNRFKNNGSPGKIRTYDQPVNSRLLYR
jgi:hypothetical protein